MNTNESRVAFADWVKRTMPEVYENAIQRTEAWRRSEAKRQKNPVTIQGMGQTETGATQPQSFWQKFIGTLSTLATTAIAYSAQKRILDTNIQRAEQGLPPIDMATGAPVLRTQVEISPEIAARLQQTAGEALPKLLIPVGIGIALMLMLGGKRRRA